MKDIIIYYVVTKNYIDGFSDCNNYNFNEFKCNVNQFKKEVTNLMKRRGYNKVIFTRIYKKDLI